MIWADLYDKIGKQPLGVTNLCDVVLQVNNKQIPLSLKFDKYCKPYLIINQDKYDYLELLDESEMLFQ